MEKQLIIGFGTGRSGTTSLSAFLNAQERTYVLHEGRLEPKIPANPFAWEGDEEHVIQWIAGLLETNSDYDWIGDIGMYYINYVDAILERWPNARFICMQRAQKEVVQSYLKWAPKKHHWIIHDGTQWQLDARWDKAFPKYDIPNKEEALNLYWMKYATHAKTLEDRLPASVKIVTLEDFNQQSGREAILDFIKYTSNKKTDFTIKENAVKPKVIPSKSKRFRNTIVAIKRYFLGKPGQRWFLKSVPHDKT